METSNDAWREITCNVRREELVSATFLIEQDFRRLVDTLARTIDIADSSDAELVERLSITKAVAERGLRLSTLLSKITRIPRK